MKYQTDIDPLDLRALLQIVTAALEHETSGRIVARECGLTEQDIDRLYSVAEQSLKG